MTFCELTYGIAFLAPLIGACSEGRKGGFLGILVGLAVGMFMGIGSLYATMKLFKYVRLHPELGKPNPNAVWTMLAWTLFVAMFACIGGFAVLGMFATKMITRYAMA